MQSIFRRGGDIHMETAMRAFNLPSVAHVDKLLHRSPCKAVNFGICYGLTDSGLYDQMALTYATAGIPLPAWITQSWCKQFIRDWFGVYRQVEPYMELQYYRARRYGYIWEQLGRIRRVPEVRSVHSCIASAGLRQSGNMPIQCIMGHMKVFTQTQGYQEMQKLEGQVTLWDGQQWSTGIVIPTGLKQKCTVTFADGGHIDCSPDHRVLIRTPKTERWMTVRELASTRQACSVAAWNNYRAALCDVAPTWKNRSGMDGLDPELVGRIASDGGVYFPRSGGGRIFTLVAEHEKILLPRMREMLLSSFGKFSEAVRIKADYPTPIYVFNTYSKQIATWLSESGCKERIFDGAWESPVTLAGYLRGMFDGDGSVTGGDSIVLTFGSTLKHLKWAHEIRLALAVLGIRARVYEFPNHACVRVRVMKSDAQLFARTVGFMNPLKQSKAEAITDSANGHAAYGRAVGITDVTMTEKQVSMWDFVNSSTGRFMAEGYILHNSLAAGVMKIGMARVEDQVMLPLLADGVWCWPLLPVHDELILEAEEDYAEGLLELTSVQLDLSMTTDTGHNLCSVPIKSDGKVMTRWEKE